MHLHFVIPDPASFQSGGNRYNAALIGALAEAGVEVTHGTFEQFRSGTHDSQTTFIFDSLYLEEVTTAGHHLPDNSLALIHHLGSMYPGDKHHFAQHEKAALDQCTGYIATSRFTRQYLADHGYPTDRIVVIEPAVDLHPEVAPRIVTKVKGLIVANCIPRKGILPLVKAIAEVQPQPYFTLHIIGSLDHDADYARQCQDLIRNYPTLLQCVRLLGEQDDSVLHKFYEESNLFLSPAYFETFGMAIQEALVYGMPALVYAGGNTPNHIAEGINGHVCSGHGQMAQYLDAFVRNTEQLAELNERASAHPVAYLRNWDDAAQILLKFVGLSGQAGRN